MEERISMEIEWVSDNSKRLREVQVSWDGCEVGAPCFPPEWETDPTDLGLLQLACSYGACPAGNYEYRRPPTDHGYSFFVEKLEDVSFFSFTEQHRTLLKHMSWEMSEPFDEEMPGCDAKRPYGDFTFYQLEMALHLGLIPREKPEGEDPMTSEIVDMMTELHHQMQPALQVFLQNFEIPDGQKFTGDEWGNWERVV